MHKQSWAAAAVFGVAGALIPGGVYASGGVLLSGLALGQVAVAGTAAGLTGGLLWRWLAPGGGTPPSRGLGALAGGLAGLFAHVPFWYILFVVKWSSEETRNPYRPLHMLYLAPLIAFFSVLALGWVTVPVGAVTGFLLASLLRRRAQPD